LEKQNSKQNSGFDLVVCVCERAQFCWGTRILVKFCLKIKILSRVLIKIQEYIYMSQGEGEITEFLNSACENSATAEGIPM